jgi:hypothetical protein
MAMPAAVRKAASYGTLRRNVVVEPSWMPWNHRGTIVEPSWNHRGTIPGVTLAAW